MGRSTSTRESECRSESKFTIVFETKCWLLREVTAECRSTGARARGVGSSGKARAGTWLPLKQRVIQEDALQ